MNQLMKHLFAICILFSVHASGGSLWHTLMNKGGATPTTLAAGAPYTLCELNNEELTTRLAMLATKPATTLELPTPDGGTRAFRIWETSLLPEDMAAKYPEIKTYTAEALDNPAVTAKIDVTSSGFHAMVYDGNKTLLINPANNTGNTTTYNVHYKKDEQRTADQHGCQTISGAHTPDNTSTTANRTVGGYQLRKYRIAIACDHQYAQAAVGTATPSKAQALNCIITTLNRINGVYERELSITMVLAARNDTLIFVNEAGDPFGTMDSDPVGLLNKNQKMCDSLIGTANYDVGHIFSTGAGGLSLIACVCDPSSKAKSVTGSAKPTGDGFDIDYVAHEIGHEFGADHTFNNNVSGNCAGNANRLTAFEPGSGSTIMAYAGICGGDNIQKHSDDYFVTPSLLQITTFVNTLGNVCATKTPTNNKPPALASYTSYYNIPYLTPFELTAPQAVDSVADTLTTYCWEQFNLGDFEKALSNTELAGPLFRSYPPDTSRTRIFPNINMVLAGQKSNAGINFAEGEKLPTVARNLKFRLTVRNILQGKGCFLFPDDSVNLEAINTGRGFSVTSQNEAGIKYIGTTVQSVTWDVVNTNTAPISASEVDIYLSLDGGYTWAYNLGRFPNTGSAIVTLPNPATTSARARIKVKGAGNVFFNINSHDFAIISNPGIYGDILLFPVPAKNQITIVTGDKGTVSCNIYVASGKIIWKGEINSITDLDVSLWPRGVYIARLQDVQNAVTIKKFVLE